MKNIRQTSIGSWVFGILFIGVGVLCLIPNQVTTLNCTRVTPGTCHLVTSGLFGTTSIEIPLNLLQGAKVERIKDKDNKRKISYTYRVIILTSSSGEIPFTSYSDSNKYEKRVIAFHINQFVKNHKILSLVEKIDNRLAIYFWSTILFAFGFYILVYGRNKKALIS